jgi:hypothetical protein
MDPFVYAAVQLSTSTLFCRSILLTQNIYRYVSSISALPRINCEIFIQSGKQFVIYLEMYRSVIHFH